MKEDLHAVYLAGKLDGKRAAERKFDKALEIEELRKDKERLDWLLGYFGYNYLDRDDIDEAMKGEA